MRDSTLADRLASHPGPLVIELWAPWCAPCRRMAPLVDRLGREYDGRVDLWKINADDQPDDVRRLGVLGIPTMIAYRNGQELGRKVGAGSEAELRALFEAGLSSQPMAGRGVPAVDRILRLAAGGALLVLGVTSGPSLLLLAVGGVVLFSAVADRCPVWQAIRPRVAALFGRRRPASQGG